MATRVPKKRRSPSPDREGMFRGMNVFLVPEGIQSRRLQVWKQKLLQMGAKVEATFSNDISHIFAKDLDTVHQNINNVKLKNFEGDLLSYQWLEDSLKAGEKLSSNPYIIKSMLKGHKKLGDFCEVDQPTSSKRCFSNDDFFVSKRSKIEDQGSKAANDIGSIAGKMIADICELGSQEDTCNVRNNEVNKDREPSPQSGSDDINTSLAREKLEELSSLYNPPDLNKNITEIFGKLINIYRGDERRSFSYYKAIPVIEKLSFKIERADQVKHLPAIGKSLQDHIQEIVTTGKLSKLEHFEKDEKVKTISLFGEVWGIGPATALKLYEKGYRTLEVLQHDDSLSNSQRLGIKFFDDIKKRIPRHEVKDMEMLLQKIGEEILPGVVIVCGGSYRRGKSSCGDLDIIITHLDGESHKGFLSKYVQRLKDIKFLREDLVFSIHSTEGSDSGVDTYFGLCTYPGKDLRHRIDFKVYPKNIYAFGLIAWTGNDVLNRRLRLLAESKGYRLDDTGLFLAAHSSSGKRGVRSGPSVSCYTEKEVFDLLGFPWLEPRERNL